MTGEAPYDPGWLALRESADARARDRSLAARAAGLAATADSGLLVVHDLGCGTGSMRRWLAPLLPGPQHWVLHDRDPRLLALALAGPAPARDGRPTSAEGRRADLTGLTGTDLAGGGLVTASALLDVLTSDQLETLAAAVARVRCPALLTLTVVGQVELTPPHPLDDRVAAAFDSHQRRVPQAGHRLLGPDAVGAAATAFGRHGARVEHRQSAWRLDPAADPADRPLVAAWLEGWVGAAHEQEPALPVDGYLAERRRRLDDGALAVVVHHADLLVSWQ